MFRLRRYGEESLKSLSGRPRPRRVALVAFSMLCVAVLQSPSPSASATASARGGTPEFMRFIHINGYRFDPLVGTPALPAALRAPRVPSADPSYYIVQFEGRVNAAMKSELEAAGAAILHYVPYNAFIVRANGSAVDRAARLSAVRWIGPLEPAYKLSPRLSTEFDAVLHKAMEDSGIAAPGAASPRVDTRARVPIRVLTAEVSRIPDVSRAVKELGGTGIATFRGNSGLVIGEIPRGSLERLAREAGVLWIDRDTPSWVFNDIARWVVQSNNPETFATPIHGHGLHGTGQTITVGDTGIDDRHNAFQDPNQSGPGVNHRKVTAYYIPPTAIGDSSDNGSNNHGTHVSGTVAGDDGEEHAYDGDPTASRGAQGPHDGQAFDAKIQVQDLSQDGSFINPPQDFHDLFQPSLDPSRFPAGTDPKNFSWIHTNSWGGCCGSYVDQAAQADDFVWNNPDYIVLFAAANFGSPSTMNIFGSAKNVIAVGASRNGTAAAGLAGFSSRGPSADGRLKPDLTAPGVSLWSAKGCDTLAGCLEDQYKQLSGTSMATPTVAGAAALVRQYFMEGWYASGTKQAAAEFTPSAALVKAVLINSAAEMNGENAYANGELSYPNNQQGWGRILLDDALYFRGDVRRLQVVDHRSGITSDDIANYQFSLSTTDPVEITLVWSDFPGAPYPEPGPNLVNDLDLVVTAPDNTVYRGNQYTGYNPGESQRNPSEGDHLNNVESVLVLSNVQPGLWTVQVSGYVPMGIRQPFALVITGVIATQAGSIQLDRDQYPSSAAVHVEVVDLDLNENPNSADTAVVSLSSDTETNPEVMTLVETGASTSLFTGSIPLDGRPAAISGDGRLQVQSRNTITATYFDADDGHGGAGNLEASATVDDDPPVISGVTATDIHPDRAKIIWNTDELSDSVVRYGTSRPPGTTVSNSTRVRSHPISLTGLSPATTYYYSVHSTDQVGNTATADNGGAYYRFDTLAVPLPGSEWPMFQNTPDRQGRSTSHFLPPLQQRWSTGSNFFRPGTRNGPALADGTLYVPTPDGFLRARDPVSGALIWERRPAGANPPGTPVVSGAVLYDQFCDDFCGIWALDARTGSTIWQFHPFIPVGPPTLGQNYLLTNVNGTSIHAFNPVDGTVVWQHASGYASENLLAIGGSVIFGTLDGITALDEATGNPLWSTPLDGGAYYQGSPLYADGKVYIASDRGTVYALEASTGSIVWQTPPFENTSFEPPAFDGATLYFGFWGTNSGYLALSAADGTVLWRTPLPERVLSAVAYAFGYLYGVASDGILRTLNAVDGSIVDSKPLYSFFNSTTTDPAVSNGWVYVTDDNGATYGFQGTLFDSDGDGDPDDIDCGPSNPDIFHGAAELCNGRDDNCLNGVDEGFDNDEDGFTSCGGDCNDANPLIHPNQVELCNGVDDNCAGGVDEGFDVDGDGSTTCAGDCNDANPDIRPGATETCNGVDDDCNGQVDEGPDTDGDGHACARDCNDQDPQIFGDEAVTRYESCFDNLDNDCDSAVDWDCAVDVGDYHVQSGSLSGLANMQANSSPDDVYESVTEGNPGKKASVFFTFFNPPLGVWWDLRVEGFRVPGNGDNFDISWARRTVTGKCTDTTGELYSPALTVIKTTDDDRLQVFQLGPPPAGVGENWAFCIKVVDSNQGNDSKADSLKLDKLYLMPILLHAKAQSEFTTLGTRNNGTSYLQTQSSDGVNEVLQEAGPSDALNHVWKIPNVPIGYAHQLHIEGDRTNGNDFDNFQFYYATPVPGVWPEQPGSFQLIPGAVVDKARGGINADFPFGPNNALAGTVWIRVLDTVPNGTSLDRLHIDYLAIKTTP